MPKFSAAFFFTVLLHFSPISSDAQELNSNTYAGHVENYSGSMLKHGMVNDKVPEVNEQESVFGIYPTVPEGVVKQLKCISPSDLLKDGTPEIAFYYIPDEGLKKGQFALVPSRHRFKSKGADTTLEMFVIPVGIIGTTRWARVSGLVLWLNETDEKADASEFTMKLELPENQNEAKARVYWLESSEVDWSLAQELLSLRKQKLKPQKN